jgi:hypothetical protein
MLVRAFDLNPEMFEPRSDEHVGPSGCTNASQPPMVVALRDRKLVAHLLSLDHERRAVT